jgi:rhodanese-related sulfurtransferase
MFTAARTRDLTPRDVQAALDAGKILLIDVREPAEFASERIQGAVNVPLSSFNPATLPKPGDRTVVFQCGSGKRSANAVDQCRKAGHPADAHLAGGIAAWKSAGLPIATAGSDNSRS